MKTTVIRFSILLPLLFFVADLRVSRALPQSPKSSEANCCQDQKTQDSQEIVAVINGRKRITKNEIDDAIGAQLYELQQRVYSLRKKALEDVVLQTVLKEEATRRRLTIEELRKQLMPYSVDVKQSDVDQSFAENLGALQGMNEEEAKQRIRLDLENRLKLEKYKAAVSEILSKARIETFLSEPIPRFAKTSVEGPSTGPLNAPVTIVEYSDFQCPYCKQAATGLKTVIQRYGPNVRLVFKQMPLPIHPDAFRAAQASVCAGEQGKFWEYHDILFSSGELNEQALKKHASTLGLRAADFNACLNSPNSAAAVRRDMQEAVRADVQGTPTFFVNGRIIRGMKRLEDLQSVIDQALRQKQNESKPASTQ